jgi:phosphate transport system substrate-binding protein
MKISVKVTLLAVALGAGLSVQAETLSLSSSDALQALAKKWAAEYASRHPSLEIQITGSDTATAFTALREKKADMATVSRRMKRKESEACEKALGKRPAEYRLGIDALAVYVNEANTLRNLTLEQLEGIFTGSIKNWKELGGEDAAITLYGPETNSPACEFFQEEVLNGKAQGAGIRQFPSPDLLQAIAKDKTAIGYGRAIAGAAIHALALKRAPSSTPTEPSAETISDQTYPLTRFLYDYLDASLEKGEVKAYLDWVRGDDGQRILKEAGFYPLPAKYRTK